MRKTIFLFIWIFFHLSLFSQRLYTNYQLFLANGDTIKIQSDLLSRKEIYRLLPKISEIKDLNDINRIEDEENRIFKTIKYKNDTLIVEQLVNGYYSLFAGVKDRYYITQDTTTYLLEKNVEEEYDYIIETKRYIGVLKYLTNNTPEFKGRIDSLKFDEESIKTLIYDININKQPDRNIKKSEKLSKQFFYLSLNMCYFKVRDSENGNYSKNYYGADFCKLHYYPSFSNNMSFRVGLNTTYVSIKYESGKENEYLYYFGIPMYINAEKTNSIITPYIYLGAFPSLILENNSVDIGVDVGVGLLTGFGLKAKPSKDFNFRTGLKYDITGWYYDIGIEFIK